MAALLYARNLANAGLAPLYSVAVKSMSESWKAFFYGAFDPRATITTDKLAGSFLPQAISARIFGFHSWSLALPQVIEGVVSVLVMYRVVRRWAGVTPGLFAAAIFALTPVAASMFGHSMEDGALTMCLVLAADSCQRAVAQARLRPLMGAAVWVGLGFQAKMLESWMALPALALAYLLAAPAPLRRRLAHLAVAGGVTLLVSLSWMTLYLVVPAADRPYIDGTTGNNVVAMVFGYNGLGRFGITLPGAAPPVNAVLGGANTGWDKLVTGRLGPEIAWLLPLALLTLGYGLLQQRARRGGQVRASTTGASAIGGQTTAGLVMWGTWLLTFGVVYSAMSVIPHTAYVAALAPPIAALSGAGIVMLCRLYRTEGAGSWVLLAAIAAQVAWTGYLWWPHRAFLPWLLPTGIAAGAIAVCWLVIARLPSRDWAALAAAGTVVGVAAMLTAPAAWAASVLDSRYAGSSFDAGAGPVGTSQFASARTADGAAVATGQPGRAGAPAGQPGTATGPSGSAGQPGAATGRGGATSAGGAGTHGGATVQGPAGATATLDPAQEKIYRYVTAHRARAGYLMAVQSETAASPYILATGQEVLPMGGADGLVPEPSLAQAQRLVRGGQLRFFLLGTAPVAPGTQGQRITGWVERSCGRVPPQAYGQAQGATDGATSSGATRHGIASHGTSPHGAARHGTASHGTSPHGAAAQGTTPSANPTGTSPHGAAPAGAISTPTLYLCPRAS